MKKFVLLTLLFSLFASTFLKMPLTVQAASNQQLGTQIVTDVNASGDYIETTLEIITSKNLLASSSTLKSKTASKTTTYKNSSGDVLWSFKVTGTFTYNGSSSTCTAVSYTKVVNSDSWSISSASVSKSGNTATGDVTAKEKFLGITINTVNKTVTLKCSASGSIS